uniref:C-type lectin domain-containing protein n=1 Tax=Cyprinus carpio TaxID=7962 RepID=A0A8C2BT50_CYPCA
DPLTNVYVSQEAIMRKFFNRGSKKFEFLPFLHSALIHPFFYPMFSSGLLSFTSSHISHQYHFINIRKNWTEAQRFCREMYTDLAPVKNAKELNDLLKTITDGSYDVYIGLYRSDVFKWHWTLSDGFYNGEIFKNRKNVTYNGGCAAMDNSWKWFNDDCDSKKNFVCFNGKIFH